MTGFITYTTTPSLSIWLIPTTTPTAEAEARADELLREWLTPEQASQLDRFGAFAIRDLLLVLVAGTSLIYDHRGAIAYGWAPEQHRHLPAADVLLCQALALSERGGLNRMLEESCEWPRGQHTQREVLSGGPAWKAVDLLMAELGA